MTDDLIQLPEAPRLDVLDGEGSLCGRFPVARVFCVGRNYGDHAREMGGDPDREPPFFFMKPASAVTTDGAVAYPSITHDLHHEIELVVAVGAPLDDVDPATARTGILGCGVGLDLTRRDLQGEAKAAGRPWEAGKVFDGAAPCGALRRGAAVLDAVDASIRLDVDGTARQEGRLVAMIWSPAEILARASRLFGLRPGDLVFTGTPSGVAAVGRGARLEGRIDGLPPLRVRID